jgi:tRNA(Arg) A34 adenosine deaminase TadA
MSRKKAKNKIIVSTASNARERINKQKIFGLIMNDEHFMNCAIEDAKLNGHRFGAIITKNNEIIAKGGKMPKGDPRFHAEIHAILEACEKLKTRDLKNCTLYATCEPCPMCYYMAWITNISRIVYGATIQDCIKIGIAQIKVTANFLNKRGSNRIELEGRILREKCLRLLKGSLPNKRDNS